MFSLFLFKCGVIETISMPWIQTTNNRMLIKKYRLRSASDTCNHAKKCKLQLHTETSLLNLEICLAQVVPAMKNKLILEGPECLSWTMLADIKKNALE